jgi:hypothetical protein
MYSRIASFPAAALYKKSLERTETDKVPEAMSAYGRSAHTLGCQSIVAQFATAKQARPAGLGN